MLYFSIVCGDFPDSTQFRSGEGFYALDADNNYTSLNGIVKTVEQITNSNKDDFMAKAGWAALGGLAFGPLGLLAGAALTGNKTKQTVCFACELHDGRKFIAEADNDVYKQFVSMAFQYDPEVADELMGIGVNMSVSDDMDKFDEVTDSFKTFTSMMPLLYEYINLDHLLALHESMAAGSARELYAAKRWRLDTLYRKYAMKIAKKTGWDSFDFSGGVVFVLDDKVILSPSGLIGDYHVQYFDLSRDDTSVSVSDGGLLTRGTVTFKCGDILTEVKGSDNMCKYFKSYQQVKSAS